MDFTVEKFLFDIPIYSKIQIDLSNVAEFDCLLYHDYKKDVEGYNSWRKVHTTFSIIRQLTYSDRGFKENGGFGSVIIQCKRYGDIYVYYCTWNPETKILLKIGQYPSLADIHIRQIKQYNKLLSHENIKEFTRAIGLAANGVGIGSYVYLRRIFESLINQAYNHGLKDGIIKEEIFQKSRMDEKIELLKNYLPGFLVDNKSMYSILSLGIHELDEDTCLAHFDTLRVGIEIILDEQLDELKKKEKIELAKKKIRDLKSKIK